MEKKLVSGIWIKSRTDRKRNIISTEFIVSLGVPSRTFVSNPQIRKAIKIFQKARKINPFGKELGYIRADFNPRNNVLTINRLYPFGSELFEWKEIFGKRGIAQLLENEFRKRAKKAFPSVQNIEEWEPSMDRIKQRLKRKFKGSSYSPEQWKINLKSKIRKDLRKAKKKKRISRRKPARNRINLK